MQSSTFLEASYFLSNKPLLETQSFILIGFKIHPDDSSDYFISNWREVSGLGNLLLSLSSKFCVKKIMFLYNEDCIPKGKNIFKFLVMLEVSHKRKDLIYLLDIVQKFRQGRLNGFISVYQEIPIGKNHWWFMLMNCCWNTN